MISTTNWLVNVDKRLTLKQVIPHIKYLQEKKQNSSHKNKDAKNYFTCNDTSIKNLGFIEFTNIIYRKKRITNIIAEETSKTVLYFTSLDDIKMNIYHSDINGVINDLQDLITSKNTNLSINLCFNGNLIFQDYISFKSKLSKLKKVTIQISKEEFISN